MEFIADSADTAICDNAASSSACLCLLGVVARESEGGLSMEDPNPSDCLVSSEVGVGAVGGPLSGGERRTEGSMSVCCSFVVVVVVCTVVVALLLAI